MRRMPRFWFLLIGCLITTACVSADSEEDEEILSVTQAATIWDSAYEAVEEAQQNISDEMNRRDGGRAATANAGWFKGTLASFTTEGTIDNPNGGGTADVSGSGGKNDDGSHFIEVTIAFTDWEADTMVVSGSITVKFTLTKLVPLQATATANGSFDVTVGKLTLPAKVEVQFTVDGKTTTSCGTVAGKPVGDGPCE